MGSLSRRPFFKGASDAGANLCVVTAIIGIAVLIRPWGEGIALSHLYGLAAGVMGGANSVMTRRLRIRIVPGSFMPSTAWWER